MTPPSFSITDVLVGILIVAVFIFATFGVYSAFSSRATDSVELVPYDGLGSGVLQHGTVLSEEYQGPNSISGQLNIEGIWIIK